VTEILEKPTSGLTHAAYKIIREAIMSGSFEPGQKLSTRKIAMSTGIGLTPVREALLRLVAERALEATHQRSARIPILTKARVHELMQLRMMLEGYAAEHAAQHATSTEIEHIQGISLQIMAARQLQDRALDIRKIYEFHFALYRCARMPDLMLLIESLWLRTGPYLNLLFPDYTKTKFGEGRGRIIVALRNRDSASARLEVEDDIRGALTFIAENFASADLHI
jgi:DNA-binding GntR family transcriptional regulator